MNVRGLALAFSVLCTVSTLQITSGRGSDFNVGLRPSPGAAPGDRRLVLELKATGVKADGRVAFGMKRGGRFWDAAARADALLFVVRGGTPGARFFVVPLAGAARPAFVPGRGSYASPGAALSNESMNLQAADFCTLFAQYEHRRADLGAHLAALVAECDPAEPHDGLLPRVKQPARERRPPRVFSP